jgi:starch phosphorylase
VDPLVKTDLPVGSRLHVCARLQLGALTPDQVAVELYVGRLDADGELTDAYAIPMQAAGQDTGGAWAFEAATVPCPRSGLHGYTVRVTPFHPHQTKAFLPGAIAWAGSFAKSAKV